MPPVRAAVEDSADPPAHTAPASAQGSLTDWHAPAIPNHFSTRDQFHGSFPWMGAKLMMVQALMRVIREQEKKLGSFTHPLLTSCCVAPFQTGRGSDESTDWGLGTTGMPSLVINSVKELRSLEVKQLLQDHRDGDISVNLFF